MRAIGCKVFGVILLICLCQGASEAQQPSSFIDYQQKMQTCALRQRAVKSGGSLYEIRDGAPQNMFTSLASLMKASDEVLLVHIDRNSSQLSPNGDHPITFYKGTVLRKWKGLSGTTVTFAIPLGLVVFDTSTKAATSIRGFHSIENGGRYIVFLRFANPEERQLTPGLRLTGDGVQGAYALEDEKVLPAYHLDPIGPQYRGMPVQPLLDQLQVLTDSAERK